MILTNFPQYQKTFDMLERDMPSDEELIDIYYSIGTFTFVGIKPKRVKDRIVGFKVKRMWFDATPRREVNITPNVGVYLNNDFETLNEEEQKKKRETMLIGILFKLTRNGMTVY